MKRTLVRLIALALLCGLLLGCAPGGPSGGTTMVGTPALPRPTPNISPTATLAATLSPPQAPLADRPRNAEGFARISARELEVLLREADITLVHVHPNQDWGIPGTDLYIPMDQLPGRLGELPALDAPIVLYCRRGNVSQAAAKFLVEQGYTNVADLAGGHAAWDQAGFSLLDRR